MQEGYDTTDPADGQVRLPVVLQVVPSLVTGGVERGTVEVAQALAEEGWTALVASAGGPMVRELERCGARHITLPLDRKNPLVMRANVQRLEEVIRQYGVDIVHARSRAPAWSAWAAAKHTGSHFVTTFHGTYNQSWLGLKKKYNHVMTRGEKVIAISDFIAEHMRQHYAVEPERIRVIPRGVDLAKFDPQRVSPQRIIQLAEKWRLPDGFPVVMLPGRLTRWKGQAVLIDALAMLGRRDIRCLLVGSDQGRSGYRAELEAQIESRGLTEIVHIVDECHDMPAAYMLTDVVVSASTDPEGFGRVIIEAQAMGRPVVATDHGGARETVRQGETGWLTAPGNAPALAAALDVFLKLTASQRAAIAEVAITYVRANFSKELMCDRTLDVYAEVLTAPLPEPEPALLPPSEMDQADADDTEEAERP